MADEYRVGPIILTKFYSAYLEDIDGLAISDLHIGFENAMAYCGLFIPKFQLKFIKTLIEENLRRYDPKYFIIVGDLKHQFSRNIPQEWEEVREIIEMLRGRNIIVIRGNHDNYLKNILKKYDLDIYPKYKIGRYLFTHGHKSVNWNDEFLVIGHEHPAISIRDSIGGTVKFSCFVLGNRFLILPSASIYSLGTDLISQEEFLTPILSREEIYDGNILAIAEGEGVVFLGKLGTLRDKLNRYLLE